jgi:hypothetical protein
MLGYRRLRDPHPRNDIAGRPFLTIVEKADDLSTPGLRDTLENIGSGCCSSPAVFIFLYRNICQEERFFCGLNPPQESQWCVFVRIGLRDGLVAIEPISILKRSAN